LGDTTWSIWSVFHCEKVDSAVSLSSESSAKRPRTSAATHATITQRRHERDARVSDRPTACKEHQAEQQKRAPLQRVRRRASYATQASRPAAATDSDEGSRGRASIGGSDTHADALPATTSMNSPGGAESKKLLTIWTISSGVTSAMAGGGGEGEGEEEGSSLRSEGQQRREGDEQKKQRSNNRATQRPRR